jgi:hypothetical protein
MEEGSMPKITRVSLLGLITFFGGVTNKLNLASLLTRYYT